jgi:hypothetical protein
VQGNVEAVPGVVSVALTSALPMQGWGFGIPFLIKGRLSVDRSHRDSCFFKMVAPSYFTVLGIKLRRVGNRSEQPQNAAAVRCSERPPMTTETTIVYA